MRISGVAFFLGVPKAWLRAERSGVASVVEMFSALCTRLCYAIFNSRGSIAGAGAKFPVLFSTRSNERFIALNTGLRLEATLRILLANGLKPFFLSLHSLMRVEAGELWRFIFRLVASGCPAAIFRRVPQFIFCALQRESIWTWPHVCEERRKRNNPSRVNSHAASAIAVIGWMVWIQAALFHRHPYWVQLMMPKTVHNFSHGMIIV